MSDRGALEPMPASEEVVGDKLPATEPVELQQELEQKDAKSAKEGEEVVAPKGGDVPIPLVDPSGDLAERIRQSEALPAGLRSRLAELVLAKDVAAGEAAVRAVEASLPSILRISGSEVTRQEHPAGEVFFHGDPEQMTEGDAEQIARGQLARSGLLRGQRAREE